MKKTKIFLLLVLLTPIWQSCQDFTNHSTTEYYEKGEDEDKIDFADFGYMLPPNAYQGRVFALSDNYPKSKPEIDKGLQAILDIDYKKDWMAYMNAVKKYVFAGNAQRDLEDSFFLEDNKERAWFHIPWQHWGVSGREGFHGLTQEGPLQPKSLAPSHISPSHAYAVGFYNDLGGYTIGKVWESGKPNLSVLKKGGFPDGTVVAKLLFVPLGEEEVPYLKNPVSWKAYIYESDLPGKTLKAHNSSRVVSNVNLIQMDIMVKDPRAISTGGWVFGTFVYQGDLENEDRWENLMPVGIMWGNDPTNNKSDYNPYPTKTVINSNLKETIINPSKDLPAMHLGWNSRLNGPVDNSYSSCVSCHSTAQYPVVSNILPQFNTPSISIPEKGSTAPDEWMKWFRNIPCGEPFDPQATSFDYSLQLVKSVQNYIEYMAQEQKGEFHENYYSGNNKVRRNRLTDKSSS
jgi:hypothetical protein